MTASSTKTRWTRGLRVTAVACALGFAGLGGATAASASTARPLSWFGATVGASGVNVRDCYHPTVHLPPSTDCTYQTSLSAGTTVHIVCQRSGQNVNGDAVWDYITYPGGEGYAADAYINTGYASWIPGMDICQ